MFINIKLQECIYNWFPVIIFLSFWICSYLIYHFGPFVNAGLNIETHIYFITALTIFIIAYKISLGNSFQLPNKFTGIDNITAINALHKTIWWSFLGTALLIIDRITSGAGSIEVFQNDLENLRQDYANKTTFITTLGVIPQSFKIITFSSYFYCISNKIKVTKLTHIIIILIMSLEIINMVLSANRGSLFFFSTYLLFFAFFCLRINLIKIFLSKKYRLKIIFITILALASLEYFYYIARYRETDSTVIYRGIEASYLLKNPEYEGDYGDLGAIYLLFNYLTAGLDYTNEIIKHVDIINFDFISALGVRVESQVAKFNPDFIFPAKIKMAEWVAAENLSVYGWSSIFGCSLAFFGIVGSFIFFFIIGYLTGYSAKKYNQTNKLGWLTITFTLYISLNMSFDWIVRDYDQFLAIVFGFFLINKKRKAS